MYQNIPTKVLTNEVRLSYANLITPCAPQQGQKERYSVTLLIPKTDVATKADIDASILAAYNDGVSKKWNGAHPTPKNIIHDGDGLRPSGVPFGDECKGCWVITASSYNKPQVVGIDNVSCELAPQDIYSGMYARVTLNFFPFDTAGSKGVGCGLGNVLKTRDGDPLGGGASAASDFEGIASAMAAAPAPNYGTAMPASATPNYGAAMPATPGAATYANTGAAPAPNYPPYNYGAPAQVAAPGIAPGATGVDPITGKPLPF